MGRPRKDSQIVDAKQRLVDSFWSLLEQHKLHQVTVGMVAQDAKCNRGTFYYHYTDMDNLIQRATEQELLASNTTLNGLFGLMTGEDVQANLSKTRDCPHIKRFALLIEQGGFDIAFKSVKIFVTHLWTCILCPQSKQLKPETRVILEYSVCGLFGMFVSSLDPNQEEGIPCTPALYRFTAENSQFLFSQICKAQETPLEEAAARLRMSDELIKAIQQEALSR